MNWTAPSDIAGYWLRHENGAQQRTVYEPEDQPIKTGILDADGNPIMRRAERASVGYLRFKG